MKQLLQKLFVLSATTLAIGSAEAGVLSIAQFTGDGDSQISSANVYTHAFDLNGDGPLTINGVSFLAGGFSGTYLTGAGYTLTGATSLLDNDATNVTGTVGQALDDFYYTGDNSGNSALTLTGLTPGSPYIARFYFNGFGGVGGRVFSLLATDVGATSMQADGNAFDDANGVLVSYSYIAPAAGAITFNFDAASDGDSVHQNLFTNQVPEPSAAVLLLGAIGTVGLMRRPRA